MCDVCARKVSLSAAIRHFLREDVKAVVVQDDGWQTIELQRGSERLNLTATGDEGGYFHWEPVS